MNEASQLEAWISAQVSTLPGTQADAARQLGMSRTALNDRLTGRAHWQVRELPAVARLCETSISELLGELEPIR